MATIYDGEYAFEVADIPMDDGGEVVTMANDPLTTLFYPTDVIFVVTDAPSAIGFCTISVGTNSPNYNNIASGLLVSLTSDGKALRVPIDGVYEPVAAEAVIKAKVQVAATTGGVCNVIIHGFRTP